MMVFLGLLYASQGSQEDILLFPQINAGNQKSF